MKPEAQDPDEIDLKQLFFTLWRHKWLIIASVMIFSILAGVIAYSVTPIYRSDGSLLISQPQNSYSMAGGSDLASLLSSTYGIGMGSTIANELQILRSRKLSLEMADSLLERRFMKNGLQYPVLFRSYPNDSTVTTQDTVAMRIRERISFTQVDREADMIEIAYESPSPIEAANMVNLSMELYTGLSTRQNRRAANSAVEFLKNERQRFKNQLRQTEEQLKEFMNEENLVQVEAQTEELIQRMADLEARRQEARVKLVAANSAIQQYQQQLKEIKPGLAEQYADAIGPNMVRLQYQLAELEIKRMQLLANNPSLQNTDTPPKALRVIDEKIALYRNKIRKLTENLISEGDQYLGFLVGADGNIAMAVSDLNKKLIELQVEKEQYLAQVEVLDKQLAELNTFFNNLPDNIITLARLKRDVAINEQLYLTVSQQYAEMSLWKETQFGLGRPVDHAFIPQKPVAPNKKLYVLVGFILGGILSVGYVFVYEAFNTKIDGVEKLKEMGPPLLAVVPDMDEYFKEHQGGKVNIQGKKISSGLVTLLDTVSPISESFRRLENNIIYSNPDQKLKTLMVTSSTKGEGKTTVTSNLGVVLAEAGYNVVIVDMDLRRPNLHNAFGLRSAPGIVETLFDDISVEEALQPTLLSNLHILSAGNRPPNPSAVTQSKAFLETIKKLEEQFDFVLVDTPPYGIITDASAMVHQTDGVVVVSRFNETTESQLVHTLESLRNVNANILGTVLTAFDYHKTSDHYYNSNHYRQLYEDYAKYNTEISD